MARDLVAESTPEPVDAKRFGTFLGVFTPSILTILGVIMYQRFGWVVGNAGLGGAIGVVLVAHVISLTTGLSVASIATNRTVRTGGNYYIISRSLGLSIGGSIGLALYLALALGVSLYLIGFAEAFVAATGVDITGNPKDDVRIIGTAACAGIALLTFYSTEIALKSQIFVLIAIALSLVSIFTGSGVPVDVGQSPVALGPPAEAASLTTVFAVFFPAVTGFTAGVGMSGDLKNPKRAIPLGTMAAILVGLAIYLVLPWFISLRAPVEDLIADNNILLRMAWDPTLVTIGVFAATLSSALGSILGAPRTLQALAFDGIVPKVFGRGRGEPRVALVLTIVIAECGILIGELELVGAILSMFFLTCYGFLCLACGLERWASADFRPQFKVPVWVSLLGAIACFMVMFQINALAMFGAIILMAVTYFVLKRRQLALSTGDTWGGVWSAVVRMGLLRLRQSTSRDLVRNWRPNMIASSRDRDRSPLVDFGRAVVGDRGILTHFHLVPGGSPKPRSDVELEKRYPGLFARVQGCDDPFTAIPDVASNFGLAGMETNVVLIGWPRDASTNARYAKMIDRLITLDISVLMLRMNREREFGAKERLDVWWDGVSPTGQLMLTLVHLLSTSPDWKNARIRVLVNGRPHQDEALAKRRLDKALGEARVNAEAVLLPPLADAAGLADRVRQESAFADLVIVHAVSATDDLGFVAVNDGLVASLGTALLVRPASTFDDAPAIFDLEAPPAEIEEPTIDLGLEHLPPPLIPPLMDFAKRLEEAAARFAQTVQSPSLQEEEDFLQQVQAELEHIRQLPGRVARRGGRKEAARGLVDWAQSRFGAAVVESAKVLVDDVGLRRREGDGANDASWDVRLRQGLARLTDDLQEAAAALPAEVLVAVSDESLQASPADGVRVRTRKWWARLVGSKQAQLQVPVRRLGGEHLQALLRGRLAEAVGHIGARRYDVLSRARRLVSDVDRCFSNLRAELDQTSEDGVDAGLFREMVLREVTGLERVAAGVSQRFHDGNEGSANAVRALVRSVRQAMVEALADPWDPAGPSSARGSPDAEGLPDAWRVRHQGLAAALTLDVRGAALVAESRRGVYQLVTSVKREIHEGPLEALRTAERTMRQVAELGADSQAVDAPSEEPPAGEEAPAADPDEQANLQQAYLAAADELRATWEKEYRPDPRKFVDQLAAALARATDRLPVSVTALDDTAGSEEDGLPPVATFAVRRLGQAFLEVRLVQTAREALKDLPDEVARAREVLVDAVRLVAFELEHVAGAGTREEDVDPEPTLSLAGVVQERVRRVVEAREALEERLHLVQEGLLATAGRALQDARPALTNPSGARSAGASSQLDVSGVQVFSRARRAAVVLERHADRIIGGWTRRQDPQVLAGGLVDELLALRDAIDTDSEVQASLPLVYRRVFGRAPLETSGLVVGRDAERTQLRRMVQRWKDGAGGPVGIVGDPRSGRSTLVNIVVRELLPGATVVRVAAPPGGTASLDALNAAVAQAVGAREGQSAEGALRGMPPGAVVVLDELGRWLERAPNGLTALTAWRRLWRRLGSRHLFVVTSTGYVWSYVEGLVNLPGSMLGFVRTGPLSREELMEGLRLRQQTSELQLSFDGHSNPSRRVERQQLIRVFERSRGNVGDAVDLWRRSVTNVGTRRVTVSVPAEPSMQPLLRLPLRWYAGLAAVAFHRGLTAARAARVLRVTREEATGLLQDLERAGLLKIDDAGVGTLDPIMQPLLLQALRSKDVLR